MGQVSLTTDEYNRLVFTEQRLKDLEDNLFEAESYEDSQGMVKVQLKIDIRPKQIRKMAEAALDRFVKNFLETHPGWTQNDPYDLDLAMSSYYLAVLTPPAPEEPETVLDPRD